MGGEDGGVGQVRLRRDGQKLTEGGTRRDRERALKGIVHHLCVLVVRV